MMATQTQRYPTRPWARWVFRVAVTCEALFAFAQAVLAGGFLAGHYQLLALHKENATFTGVAAVVMTLVAVVQWRPGRGPLWPVFVSAALFAAEAVQIVLGYARVLIIHIPLGVSIIAAIVLLLVWAWKPITPSPDEDKSATTVESNGVPAPTPAGLAP